jgi:hypothetical protein
VYDEVKVHTTVKEDRTREVPRTVYNDVISQGSRPTVTTDYRFEEDTKTRTVTTVTYEDVQERKERTKFRTETRTAFRDVVQHKYRTAYRDEVVQRSRDEVVTKYRTEVRDKTVIKYKEVPVDAVRDVEEDVDVWTLYPHTVTKYVTETKQRENFVEKTCEFQDTREEDRVKTVVEYRQVEETVTESVPVTKSRTIIVNGEEKTELWVQYEDQEFTNLKYKPFNVDQHYTETVTFTNTRDCSYTETVDYTVKTPYDVTEDTPHVVTETVSREESYKTTKTVPFEVIEQELVQVPYPVTNKVAYTETIRVPFQEAYTVTRSEPYLETVQIPYTEVYYINKKVPHINTEEIPFTHLKKVSFDVHGTESFDIATPTASTVYDTETYQVDVPAIEIVLEPREVYEQVTVEHSHPLNHQYVYTPDTHVVDHHH